MVAVIAGVDVSGGVSTGVEVCVRGSGVTVAVISGAPQAARNKTTKMGRSLFIKTTQKKKNGFYNSRA
jgi:hypothetical protein